MPTVLKAAGLTDVGRKRTHNEDSYSIDNENSLFVVADGMGGHASGEVASQMAVETMSRFYKETDEDEDRTWPFKMSKTHSYPENRLIMAIKLANKLIFQRAQDDLRLKGMGTTIVATQIYENDAYFVHVGDSRAYRIREGKIKQLTEDHSLLNDYMKIKKLTPEEIKNFPHKNVIVRALGMKDLVQVDFMKSSLRKDDLFMLCSDGLSGLIEDDDMLKIILEHESDLDNCCQKLIDGANGNGGNDNITVALVRVVSPT